MASSPDLFVVCKNCGSEVSPYITECPYCGTRLRKRAPKIERDGTVSEPKPKKQKKQRAPRVRRERPSVGAAVDRRPYATLALVLLSLFGYLVLSAVEPADIAVAGPIVCGGGPRPPSLSPGPSTARGGASPPRCSSTAARGTSSPPCSRSASTDGCSRCATARSR